MLEVGRPKLEVCFCGCRGFRTAIREDGYFVIGEERRKSEDGSAKLEEEMSECGRKTEDRRRKTDARSWKSRK